MHQREIIRAAVKAQLIAAGTVAEGRVLVAQAVPRAVDELPAITIWTPSDKTRESSVQSSPRELDQDLVLEVTAWVADGDNDDEATANALDTLCGEIETAMHTDPFFGKVPDNACADSFLNGTALDLAQNGEQMMGRAVLEYGFVYRTSAPVTATDPNLDDFDTGHSEIVLSDDANDAQNTFNVSVP